MKYVWVTITVLPNFTLQKDRKERGCALSLRTRKHEFAAVPLTFRIVVEEVTVQGHLYQPADPSDDVDKVLGEVAVDPVDDVQPPINTHGPNEVGSQVLHFLGFLQQNELGDDGHTFQPYGRRPAYLVKGKFFSGHNSKQKARSKEIKLVLEAVVASLIRLADW